MRVEQGKIVVMETIDDAFSVWIRPQDWDYRSGGIRSVLCAGWDYALIDPSISPEVSGVELKSASTAVQEFYDRLCDDPRQDFTEEHSYDLTTGEHDFPPEFPFIRVLDAYRTDPTGFDLLFLSDGEDLFMMLHNLKNNKKFRVSASSDDGYIREVFFVLLNHYDHMRCRQPMVTAKYDDMVNDFLTD